jgi:hypothetical protein
VTPWRCISSNIASRSSGASPVSTKLHRRPEVVRPRRGDGHDRGALLGIGLEAVDRPARDEERVAAGQRDGLSVHGEGDELSKPSVKP